MHYLLFGRWRQFTLKFSLARKKARVFFSLSLMSSTPYPSPPQHLPHLVSLRRGFPMEQNCLSLLDKLCAQARSAQLVKSMDALLFLAHYMHSFTQLNWILINYAAGKMSKWSSNAKRLMCFVLFFELSLLVLTRMGKTGLITTGGKT